jgi:hypothetical protein
VDDPNTPLPSIFNSIVDRGANEYRPCVAPENYCTSAQNSVGAGSLIGFSGTGSVLANNLVLRASGNPPGAIGVFLLGHTPIATPFGNGVRCVDGGVVRLSPLTCDANGVAVFAFDVHAPPALVDAGEIRRFQFWYRDSSGGGAGFNLSDGLLVHFCP